MNNIATHSFSVELATKYGVMEAIMLGHIAYWVNFNRNAKKNFHDEKYWMYQSMKEMACHFPYLSEDQIFRVISKLVKKGLLIKGNFNKIKFDKTSWYTIGNEILENNSSAIPQNRGIDDTNSRNRSNEFADPIPDTKERCLKEDNISASAPSASATAERLYSSFIEKLKNINPKRKELSKGERIQWVAEFDKMLTEDNRTEEEIQKIIDWFSTDAFWIKPIKDVITLRRNFDTMVPHVSAPSTNESRNKEYIKEILESNPTQTIVEVTAKYVKIVPANKELYFANLTPIAFKEAFETLMRPYCED